MTQGLSEWRSIQDVVQLTFQAFFDALRTQVQRRCRRTARDAHLRRAPLPGLLQREPSAVHTPSHALAAQGDAIKGLEKSRDTLATSLRTELAAAVRGKAGGAELAARLAEVGASPDLLAMPGPS